MQLNPFKILKRAVALKLLVDATYEWIREYILPQLAEEDREELSLRIAEIKRQIKGLL